MFKWMFFYVRKAEAEADLRRMESELPSATSIHHVSLEKRIQEVRTQVKFYADLAPTNSLRADLQQDESWISFWAEHPHLQCTECKNYRAKAFEYRQKPSRSIINSGRCAQGHISYLIRP